MNAGAAPKVALLFRGSRDLRAKVTPANNRLSRIFEAFAALRVAAEPVVYADEMIDEVREQLLGVDGVLVWVNPIQDGEDRSLLDPMLREVADEGVWVSAHPDVIQKMGTKEVLYRTRELGWGTDTHIYASLRDLEDRLPSRLASDGTRVLKQNRGNGGEGTWKVGLVDADTVEIDHAWTHSATERVRLRTFIERCAPYFESGGCMIDQPFQSRLAEGAVRCYLTHDAVVGFAHQMPRGFLPRRDTHEDTNLPGPSAHDAERIITEKMESEWVPAMMRLLDIEPVSLPVIWDADFLYGPRTESGEDTFVLSEIKFISVFPFPEKAIEGVARATLDRLVVQTTAAPPAGLRGS